jgi:hypothetical protein
VGGFASACVGVEDIQERFAGPAAGTMTGDDDNDRLASDGEM